MTGLCSTYERINSVAPRTLLKIVLYSYMNGVYSSCSMELNCKRDINFMFFERRARSRPCNICTVPEHPFCALFKEDSC